MFLLEVSLLLRYKMKFGQNGVKKNLFSSCLTPYLLLYLLPNNYTVCKLNMEIKGRIIHVLPLQEGVSKAGNPWKSKSMFWKQKSNILGKFVSIFSVIK